MGRIRESEGSLKNKVVDPLFEAAYRLPVVKYFHFLKDSVGYYKGRKYCDCQYWCGSSQCFNDKNMP